VVVAVVAFTASSQRYHVSALRTQRSHWLTRHQPGQLVSVNCNARVQLKVALNVCIPVVDVGRSILLAA